MRVCLLGGGKEDAFPSPVLRHADRPKLPVQTIHGSRSDRFAVVEPGDPPVIRSVASGSHKQQMLAIGRPDGVAGERKTRLNPAGGAAIGRHDKNLAGAEGGAHLLLPGHLGEGDPFPVRGELRSPAFACHQSGRAAPGDWDDVDPTALPIGAKDDAAVIR